MQISIIDRLIKLQSCAKFIVRLGDLYKVTGVGVVTVTHTEWTNDLIKFAVSLFMMKSPYDLIFISACLI